MSSKILTAQQMREVDRVTSESLGIPSRLLMENAGRSVVEVMEKRFAPLGQERIAVICGKGNNGGDGFVVARHLLQRGITPRVFVLADPTALQGDARANYDALVKWGVAPTVARGPEEWAAARLELFPATLLVDAILGTGLDRPVEGFLSEVILDINAHFSHLRIIAVDMPSGLPSDSGAPLGESLSACCTVTFTARKHSQIFPPNCARVGELIVAPIGTPPSVYERNKDFYLNLLGREDIVPFLAPRRADAHKGSFGHVLVVGGSRGKSGAAALAGLGALRAGAGLVTVATAESVQPQIAGASPALMTECLLETGEGTISSVAVDRKRFAALLEGKSVLVIGPGISTHPDTVEFVRRAVQESAGIPVVMDADGLNAFAGAAGLGMAEAIRGKGRTLVLTPHPGEMARLTGMSASQIQSSRVEVARQFAMEHHVYLVLKGSRTLIAEPGGQVYVNPTGNPGMATAGTGDVLAGMIGAMLAQQPQAPPQAHIAKSVSAAVYWHGAAGDCAAQRWGEMSMIATDLIEALPGAIKADALRNVESGSRGERG